MRWDAPAGASQYCLDTGNEDVGAAPQCPMMNFNKIIRAFVGAQFIAPTPHADSRHLGRNELRPYIQPFICASVSIIL